jgi:hypothetical protein
MKDPSTICKKRLKNNCEDSEMIFLNRKYLLLIFISFVCMLPFTSAEAYELVIKWEKIENVNGLGPEANAIKSADNNLIIVSKSYLNDKYGLWIAKYDFAGNDLFKKSFQIEEGLSDFNIDAILNAENENILVLGNGYSDGYKMWLRKFDKKGNLLFKKLYSHKKSISPGSIATLDDGNYMITGTEDFRNIINIKIDNQGNKLWEKIYENNLNESIALSTTMNSENILGVSVAGKLSKFGTGDSNIKLTKYDSRGEKIRDIVFPGRVTGLSEAITSDSTKNYFYLSYDSPAVVKGDVCDTRNVGENVINVIKFDSNLEKIWNKPFGKKMTLVFPPLINRIGDNYILAGSYNITRAGIEPAKVFIIDKNGDKICELLLKNHMVFLPVSIVVNENDILLIGTEMVSGKGVDSKIVIMNIGYK